MLKYIICFTIVICGIYTSYAQDWSVDSLWYDEVPEMIVTATRTERHMGNVAVPVQIVTAKSIELSGTLRLNEILQEQTGLFLTSGTGSSAIGGGVFGNGIQIQGLSPDHSLILLDGEPIIGRQGGVIDLSRFTVGNIRKIEIVKGPSSALYGSEAMGGVVNILTEQRRKDYFKGGIRYGSFENTDVFTSVNKNYKKSTVHFFANYNSSAGYDLNPSVVENTMDPQYNMNLMFKYEYRFSEKTRLNLNNRFFYGSQKSEFGFNSQEINTVGFGNTLDINVNPVLTHRFSEELKNTLRLYTSIYRFDQDLSNIFTEESYYADNFLHEFHRIENQTDWDWKENRSLTIGGGYNLQSVETTRYRERKNQHISYFFVQEEWHLNDKWTIIPGFRYDINSDFANRLSPKIALQHKPSKNTWINASYGGGFKAPDFRQLYLFFINPAAQGYRVYGAEEFSVHFLEQQMQEGLIANIFPAAYDITTLSPEISHGFNLGGGCKFTGIPLTIDLNVFHNEVSNLINYLPVAITNGGGLVFSYLNLRNAFTQGAEINFNGHFKNNFEWGLGYQYLRTGDRDVIRDIQAGKVFGRNEPGGRAARMSMNDYTGLMGRSPHMLNARLVYQDRESGWGGAIRANFQSSWGAIDLDGNGFANMPEEFARGFCLLNASIQKEIKRNYSVQLTLNNLLNHMDHVNTPQMPGTNFLVGFNWNFD
jgi:outer membrane receptor for ferrienterochelin and colicins